MKRLSILALLTVGVGCNQIPDVPPPTFVTVTGKVVLATGYPMSGGRIQFIPIESGSEMAAEIGRDGTFRFAGAAGLRPAKYKVTVSTLSYKSGNPVEVPQDGKVPAKYNEIETTPLTATVNNEDTKLEPFRLDAK